jgi:phosphopentomutase
LAVHGVGKIGDLFAGRGISVSHPGSTNEQALASIDALLQELDGGLAFANLIETDQTYGHRKDAAGFAAALEAVDERVGGMLGALRDEDLLVVTADHGVDPDHPGTDHTREYAPLLAVTGAMAGRVRRGGAAGGFRHDGALAGVGAAVCRWLCGERAGAGLPGRPFIS